MFTTPVQQSHVLQQAAGVEVPEPLTDMELQEPATKRARRLAAEKYVKQVGVLFQFNSATEDDLDSANVYHSQVHVAESMPSIQRNLAPIAAADVAAAIMGPINAQFANINAQFARVDAQFAQLSARQLNSFSNRLSDPIVPLPRLPPILVAGQVAPPEPALPQAFPATREELLSLTNNQVIPILQYYNQPTHGTVIERRERLLRFLGLPPVR